MPARGGVFFYLPAPPPPGGEIIRYFPHPNLWGGGGAPPPKKKKFPQIFFLQKKGGGPSLFLCPPHFFFLGGGGPLFWGGIKKGAAPTLLGPFEKKRGGNFVFKKTPFRREKKQKGVWGTPGGWLKRNSRRGRAGPVLGGGAPRIVPRALMRWEIGLTQVQRYFLT